jgi:hypothetical protein
LGEVVEVPDCLEHFPDHQPWEGEVRAECFEADKAVDCHLIGLTEEDPCLPRNVLKRLQAMIPGCAEPQDN